MKSAKNVKLSKHPFVSICTPTFNRRPFIPYMIKCFEHQTYPKDQMEWIIIDDGPDKIEDMVKHIPQVRYFKYDEKMTLGKKRNLAHDKSCGEVIVYMDDDDYYPPERVSHAVDMLKKNPSALCAGSSEMHIYFKHINQMYKFGPYTPTHATAATFACRAARTLSPWPRRASPCSRATLRRQASCSPMRLRMAPSAAPPAAASRAARRGPPPSGIST